MENLELLWLSACSVLTRTWNTMSYYLVQGKRIEETLERKIRVSDELFIAIKTQLSMVSLERLIKAFKMRATTPYISPPKLHRLVFITLVLYWNLHVHLPTHCVDFVRNEILLRKIIAGYNKSTQFFSSFDNKRKQQKMFVI